MASYSLSGSGTQALSSGTVALHVTITTLPGGAGHGLANPTDYWGVGSVRPGNATAFWEPFVICGGPQWLPVPFGTTRLGYAFTTSAVVSVAEVFWPAPLAYPLALLPDVALGTLADAQVLTYQASTGHWINAAPAGGGGGGGGESPIRQAENLLTSAAASVVFSSIPATHRHLRILCQVRTDVGGAGSSMKLAFNGDTGANYDRQHVYAFGGSAGGGDAFGESSVTVAEVAGNGAPSGVADTVDIVIPNYRGTTFQKSGVSKNARKAGTSGGNIVTEQFAFYWRNTAAITSVTLLPGGGNFMAGCLFSLYLEP